MLDVNFLSQFPHEVVGARLHDDLPCAICDDYGPIMIVEIQDCTYDICHRCAASVVIKW